MYLVLERGNENVRVLNTSVIDFNRKMDSRYIPSLEDALDAAPGIKSLCPFYKKSCLPRHDSFCKCSVPFQQLDAHGM
jgi:hypothetical protein